MGADAILMGSRMIVASESGRTAATKSRCARATHESRVVMKIFRNHHRVLDNEAARAVEELERQGVDDFARYEPIVSGANTHYAYSTGDTSQA